jgi:hypothetical protein
MWRDPGKDFVRSELVACLDRHMSDSVKFTQSRSSWEWETAYSDNELVLTVRLGGNRHLIAVVAAVISSNAVTGRPRVPLVSIASMI